MLNLLYTKIVFKNFLFFLTQKQCTTPKYTPLSQNKQNIKRPSPTANKTATPMSAALKTPQRSILKAESGNSIVKKRRVVFASDDENGSDSSSSEMMEVEVKFFFLVYDFNFEIYGCSYGIIK